MKDVNCSKLIAHSAPIVVNYKFNYKDLEEFVGQTNLSQLQLGMIANKLIGSISLPILNSKGQVQILEKYIVGDINLIKGSLIEMIKNVDTETL